MQSLTHAFARHVQGKGPLMMMSFDDDWLGCGNAEHPQECLCDVVITQPTQWVNDCVNDIHMGPQICEIRGYSIPWTREQLVNYLDDLMLFQNALRGSVIMDDTPSSVPTDKSRISMETVRNTVMDHMKQDRPNIQETLNLLGISGQIFLTAVTTNQMPELKLAKWSSYLLAEFQRDIEQGKLGFREMMKKYDLTRGAFYNLKSYFVNVKQESKSGTLVSINPERQSEARVIAKRLISDGHENVKIIEQVFNETQIKYTSSAISKLRSRNSDLDS